MREQDQDIEVAIGGEVAEDEDKVVGGEVAEVEVEGVVVEVDGVVAGEMDVGEEVGGVDMAGTRTTSHCYYTY